MTLRVRAFYKFVEIDGVANLRQSIYDACCTRALTGSIIVADEGINGTICGEPGALDAFFGWLRGRPGFGNLDTKDSPSPGHPFKRLKVTVKPEIVTFGVAGVRPVTSPAGTYVEPEDWNALIADPSVTLIDTRNFYEAAIGTFAGAIDPGTLSFREFPTFVGNALDPERNPKIAMFCTGGIRCEKASVYLRSCGFNEIHQLRGGILNYLETIPADESLWRGECFVFDERVALGHGVQLGKSVLCRCGHPVFPADAPNGPHFEGIQCGTCIEKRNAMAATA